MKVFLHSREGLGARKVLAEFAGGRAHSPRPYGFEAAEELGVSMSYSEDARPDSALKPGTVRYWSWKLFGFDLLHAWHNRRAMREADAIWTVLEWEWLPVSMLQRLKVLPRRPIIGNSVWLMDYWSGARRRSRLYRWLMTPNVRLTLHSEAAREKAEAEIPDRTFHVVPFGISTRAFPLADPKPWTADGRPIRIYAIGNDRTRDWRTMMAAFGNDPRFEVRIICTWIGEVLNVAEYDNLSTPDGAALEDQLASYAWSDVVIMPMSENVYSGITVVLEAVARGVPVVSSRTGGVPTYFSEDEVLYVPPGDAGALREAVLRQTPEEWRRQAEAASARFRRSDYSEHGMARRYLQSSEEMLRRRAPGRRLGAPQLAPECSS